MSGDWWVRLQHIMLIKEFDCVVWGRNVHACRPSWFIMLKKKERWWYLVKYQQCTISNYFFLHFDMIYHTYCERIVVCSEKYWQGLLSKRHYSGTVSLPWQPYTSKVLTHACLTESFVFFSVFRFLVSHCMYVRLSLEFMQWSGLIELTLFISFKLSFNYPVSG